MLSANQRHKRINPNINIKISGVSMNRSGVKAVIAFWSIVIAILGLMVVSPKVFIEILVFLIIVALGLFAFLLISEGIYNSFKDKEDK